MPTETPKFREAKTSPDVQTLRDSLSKRSTLQQMWKAKWEGCRVNIRRTAGEGAGEGVIKLLPEVYSLPLSFLRITGNFPDEPLSSKNHTRADRKERNQRPGKTPG